MVLFGSEPNLFQSFGGMDRCIGTKHRKKTALNLELAQTLNSTSPTASIYQINLPIPLSPRPSSRSPAPIPTRDPIPIPISPPSSAPISAPVTLPNGCFKCPVCPRSKFRTQSQAKSHIQDYNHAHDWPRLHCLWSYDTPKDLLRHIKGHSADRQNFNVRTRAANRRGEARSKGSVGPMG